MSFKIFIYYCGLLGGWAALVVWGFTLTPLMKALVSRELLQTSMVSGLLGLLMALTVGGLDAVLNASSQERMMRVSLCAIIGLIGGAAGGFLGQLLYNRIGVVKSIGWVLVGVSIGSSIAVFDLIRAASCKEESRVPLKKLFNGVLGGLLGGLIGGLIFEWLPESLRLLPRTGRAIGFVTLGASIGLLIGLAQVFLKEAWLKVESGFRAGREIMLSKGETTIGRSESCDVGIFGDNVIERLHMRIRQQDRHYQVEDAGTSGGTFLNEQRLTKAMPLRNGDLIRIGNSTLRFGERAKN